VRIVESGADVQTSNTYEIAFERPFPREAQVEGGQYSDHPKTGVMDALANLQVRGGQNADPYLKVGAELVSGLTRTGQNTDQGGQPVVHERNEVLDKTQTSSSCLPQDAAGASDPASEEQEEVDGCALESNPDALAVIAAVDLGGMALDCLDDLLLPVFRAALLAITGELRLGEVTEQLDERDQLRAENERLKAELAKRECGRPKTEPARFPGDAMSAPHDEPQS